ncbi:Xaa-Pro dipeptidase [Thermogymnomonas acidicola]|uniref:Xaa-Pro dipeptidase n=1 Tax=Thermogymnomonas acidicola TaxID=399579 RepID=A0AA37F9Q5_9ARCH|nr:amidohydrolase family protein [Thermogymnomonas acidicola]GGM76395.1 Xaa-Pro dipeptidase [Thermogymnomonas acidicola]
MRTVIRARTVFSGLRTEAFREVAVEGGTIVETGNGLRGDSVIDLGDRFMMPGMVDAHIHLSGSRGGGLTKEYLMTDPRLRLLRLPGWCRRLLSDGFTTVRDCGEELAIPLRDAIAEGSITGPRVYAAGRPLSQTFGHGEFSHSIPLSWSVERGMAEFCDGSDECMRKARLVLRSGADFIKVFATGGVLSERDRPESPQFTPEELGAIVGEASRAGKYVAAHAHGDQGALNAVLAGVKSIEHGTLLSERTLAIMKERDVSLTPTLSIQQLIWKHGKEIGIDTWGLEKIGEVRDGIIRVLPLAHRMGINILCGTDLGMETGREIDIGRNHMELVLMHELCGLPNDYILRAATYNARALGIRGGLIAPGEPADIIAVDGSPLTRIGDIERVSFVMKGGSVLVDKERGVAL